MIGNLSKVEHRLEMYRAAPDKQFQVKSGLAPHEEAVKQRVRQYWADTTIPDVKKLEGLNIDMSGFDPRRTSNRQLMEIGALLAEQGLIDDDLARALSNIDVQLDAQGNDISMDREVDAYDFLNNQLSRLSAPVFKGNEIAHGEWVEVSASISVLMALESYAKAPRERSLVNIRI